MFVSKLIDMRHTFTTSASTSAPYTKTCTCPSCSAVQEVIEIFYGIPTVDTFLSAKQGSLAIGGSDLWPYRYSHVCKSCTIEFDENGNYQQWLNPFAEIEKESNIAA